MRTFKIYLMGTLQRCAVLATTMYKRTISAAVFRAPCTALHKINFKGTHHPIRDWFFGAILRKNLYL